MIQLHFLWSVMHWWTTSCSVLTLNIYQSDIYIRIEDLNQKVLTPRIEGRHFLAYNLQSMYSKRCDRDLHWLTALGGREVWLRGFWNAPDTITQSKRVQLLWQFLCVFFLVFMRCTPNWSSLAWFFSFKTFRLRSSSGIYVSLINIHG